MSGTKASEKCRTPGLSIRPLSEESPYQSWRCQTQGSETWEESHLNRLSWNDISGVEISVEEAMVEMYLAGVSVKESMRT